MTIIKCYKLIIWCHIIQYTYLVLFFESAYKIFNEFTKCNVQIMQRKQQWNVKALLCITVHEQWTVNTGIFIVAIIHFTIGVEQSISSLLIILCCITALMYYNLYKINIRIWYYRIMFCICRFSLGNRFILCIIYYCPS